MNVSIFSISFYHYYCCCHKFNNKIVVYINVLSPYHHREKEKKLYANIMIVPDVILKSGIENSRLESYKRENIIIYLSVVC